MKNSVDQKPWVPATQQDIETVIAGRTKSKEGSATRTILAMMLANQGRVPETHVRTTYDQLNRSATIGTIRADINRELARNGLLIQRKRVEDNYWWITIKTDEPLVQTHGKKGVRQNKTIPRGRRNGTNILTQEEEEILANAHRPRTRADCKDGPRPCPWVACRYHLYLDIRAKGGITLNFPEIDPSEMPKDRSCALDIADGDPITQEDVATVMNITKERARQLINAGKETIEQNPVIAEYGELIRQERVCKSQTLIRYTDDATDTDKFKKTRPELTLQQYLALAEDEDLDAKADLNSTT